VNTDTIQTGRKARAALPAAILLLALAWAPLNAPGADPGAGPAGTADAPAPAGPGGEETAARADGQAHAAANAPAAKQQGHPHREPKELPVFFIIGIAINFAMMTTFAWWFIGEWRKTKR